MKEYAQGLEEYLTGGGETALERAYELGRGALARGLGILDMVLIHHEALAMVPAPALRPEERSPASRVAPFFMESLSAFEMTHRAFREANLTLRRLNELLEDSAKRIAHALHDEASQLLVPMHIALAEVAGDFPGLPRERLQEIRGLLYQIEERLRQLSHELRPVILDDLGIVAAVEFLAQGVSQRAGLAVAVEGASVGRLPPQIEIALYRVVQEALTNVTKHARATRVKIHLKREERKISCTIQDDGSGFEVATVLGRQGQEGLGLRGIRERLNALGGRLQLTSAPNRGTELVITIPIEV